MKRIQLVLLLVTVSLFTTASPTYGETYICSYISNTLMTFTRKGQTFQKTDSIKIKNAVPKVFRIVSEDEQHIVAANNEYLRLDPPMSEVIFVDKDELSLSYNVIFPFGEDDYSRQHYGMGGELESCSRID